MPVVQKRVYLLLTNKSSQSVIINNILLKELLYFLPVDLINEYQHNVLGLYHMNTHFPFGLIK